MRFSSVSLCLKRLYWLVTVLFLLSTFPFVASAQESADGLAEALRLTATLHPSVKSKLEELRALGFDLESANYQRYPTLSLQAQTMSDSQQQVVAALQQPLWVGGRIDGSIEQSDVKLKIGTLALLGVRRQLIENAAAIYATLQGARMRLKAAELNVIEHEKLKELISRRESGGIASRADVLLAASRTAQAAAQRIQLEGVLLRAQNDLLALTQKPLPGVMPVGEGMTMLPAENGISADIEKASATVLQRLIEVDLASAAEKLAFANMMPSLYAKLEQNVYVSSKYGESPHDTRVGLVLQGSLEGLGLSSWNRVKSSDARIDAAKRDVETARNDARRQAMSLLTDLRSLRLVMESNELLVKSTEETLASFMRQYDAGRKSWVDVLNTQRELSDARLGLEQTKSSLQETSLRLAAQLGLLDSHAGIKQ